MPAPLVLRNACLQDGRLVDLTLAEGVVQQIADGSTSRSVRATASADEWLEGCAPEPLDVDLDGRLVVPALVNGHAHLDKTFVGAPWQPHRTGTDVQARVAAERAQRRTIPVPVGDRAAALAEAMIRFGTGTVRTHVDIDPEVGLTSLDAMLELRDRVAGRLDVQIVAFPQSGILASPGVDVLLGEALRAGADVVGGLDPHDYDGDADAHLDIVFGIADRHGAGVDIHLHELGESAVRQFARICERTRALGLSGRVVISHAYGLGSIPDETARRIGGMLAGAGVAIMTNGPAGPMPPVLALREEGATVFSGSDNIRDAWWPYGDGDMLDVARTVAYQSGFRTDAELDVALDMVTTEAARALGLPRYGIAPASPAHLLILPRLAPAQIVAAPPEWRAVVHDGRLVSSSRSIVTDFVRDREPIVPGR